MAISSTRKLIEAQRAQFQALAETLARMNHMHNSIRHTTQHSREFIERSYREIAQANELLMRGAAIHPDPPSSRPAQDEALSEEAHRLGQASGGPPEDSNEATLPRSENRRSA